MAGRAAFRATEEQRRTVHTMAGYGIPQEEIARVVINPATGRPIMRKTLSRHFTEELATGATEANMKVAQSLYRQAVDGHVTAAIFWCKTRMGWREASRGAAAGGSEAGAPVIESRIELGGDSAGAGEGPSVQDAPGKDAGSGEQENLNQGGAKQGGADDGSAARAEP